jgi:tetratricopeptide (TPR) repeat protein
MTEPGNRRPKWLVCALLGAAAMAVFSPALHGGFVNYDDPAYVTENWHVRHGLTGPGFRWAFTSLAASNWHPLTWLSHMLDCQLYGLAPAGHHLTSLLLHAANAVLLFLLLNRLTGALWRSAFVAAMFALHPLRVESVVWVSERKDVLSAFFWMLAVGAYVRYAENLKLQIANCKIFYALALVFFALGLMAKPMLVTLPFVLLLLDYWPLGRWKSGPAFSWRPVWEKIPFLVLTAASSLVTFLAQDRAEAVASLARFPLSVRLANIPVAYIRYLTKTFWPSHLASYYPFVGWSAGEISGAVALLAGVTGLALWRVRRAPWLAVGWFWFLGMLVPAIGLVQAGGQSLADRYSYLPGIGLWIMLVWSLPDATAWRPRPRQAMGMAAGLAVILFAWLAWRHAGVYQDSGTLWAATLRSYPQCLAARNNLAIWLMDQGRWDEALGHCRDALAIRSEDAEARNNLSLIFLHQRKLDEAIAEALQSIQSQPRSAGNRQTLARAYLQKGDFAAAAASLREAIQITPDTPEAWCNLGYALLQQGKMPEATTAYERALALNPDYALAHNDLGNILLRQGRLDEAMDHFQRAVELAPSFAEAHYNLAGILARRGRLDEAISHLQKAVEIQPALAAARDRLAALLAARERNSGR